MSTYLLGLITGMTTAVMAIVLFLIGTGGRWCV